MSQYIEWDANLFAIEIVSDFTSCEAKFNSESKCSHPCSVYRSGMLPQKKGLKWIAAFEEQPKKRRSWNSKDKMVFLNAYSKLKGTQTRVTAKDILVEIGDKIPNLTLKQVSSRLAVSIKTLLLLIFLEISSKRGSCTINCLKRLRRYSHLIA